MKDAILQKTCLVGLLILLALPATKAADDDPGLAPIPDIYDVLLDTRRAIYIEFSILADGTAQLLDSGVTNVPPAATDEEPALLLIESLDADNQVLGSQNAWDPRYQLYLPENEGQDELVIVDEGVGVFQVLFDPRIVRFRLSDQQQDPIAPLAVFDVQALVEDFCTNNPADDNCEGFDPGDADGDGIADEEDQCPGTPTGETPDSQGCSPSQLDDDGDGVANDADRCPGTPAGEIVDADGCSVPIDEACSCESDWKNHGAYVSCVARNAKLLVETGEITSSERGEMISAAAKNDCGK